VGVASRVIAAAIRSRHVSFIRLQSRPQNFSVGAIRVRLVGNAVLGLLLVVAGPPCEASAVRPDQDDADLHAVTQVGRRVAWAVGDRGVAWTTRDAGLTWTAVSLPGHVACRSVCFLSNRVGWVAGSDERPGRAGGVVLATRDGGAHWKTIRLPVDQVRHVRFFDLQHGLVVGQGNAGNPSGVVETRDGGHTWRPLAGTLFDDWRTAAFSNEGHGVVAGGSLQTGTISEAAVLTSDGGPRTRRAWWGSAIGGRRSAWLVGDAAAVLFRSPNRSAWSTPETPLPGGLANTTNFRAVAASGQQAWISGSPGSTVWHTPDGGRHWERQATGQTLPLNAISINSDGHGFAVGALGVILRTTDAGDHWTTIRGHGRRLAMLAIHVTSSTLPLGVIARDSAESGYRSAGFLFSVSPAEWREADRAVRSLGGQGVDTGWRLGVDQPELSRNAKQLEQRWRIEAEEPLDDMLVGRLIGLFRTWRPSVVIIDSGDQGDHAARLVRQSVIRAIRHSADPTRWAVPAALTGLTPWAASRLFERTSSSGAVAVRVGPDTLLHRHAETVGAVVHRSRLTLSGTQGRVWTGDGLKRTVGSGRPLGDSVCQGLGLAAGSQARRSVPSALADSDRNGEIARRRSLALAAWIRLADSGSRPFSALQGELPTLLRGMDDRRAGWSLWNLAERFRDAGDLPLAESLLTELVARYPSHDASAAASIQLLGGMVSRERRWQRLKRTGRKAVVTAPVAQRPTNGTQSGGGFSIATRSFERPIRLATKADWRSEAAKAEMAHAVQLAKGLRRQSAALFEIAETQLTLAALFRSRQSAHLADRFYRRLATRPGPWQSIAAQEVWLADRNGTPPTRSVVCQEAVGRPVLDGVLSDPCWEYATEMRLKSTRRLSITKDACFALVACDDRHLYLGARMERTTTPGQGTATGRSFDADHTGFDRLTVFLDTDRDYQLGYELTIDERGQVSERCGKDPAWNPRCHVAVDSDDSAWRFEMAIPWTELAAGRPASASCWGLRLTRTIPAIGWQGWGGVADERGAPSIGAGLMTFAGGPSAERRR